MLYAKNDFDGNFKSYCTQWGESSYINRQKCLDMFDGYFKVVGECDYTKQPTVTYNKAQEAYVDIGANANPSKRLADGSCYDLRINAGTFGFSFDMDGADKGPNAMGHDIFFFHVDKNDFLVPIKMTAYTDDDTLEEALSKCEPKPYMTGCTAIAHEKGRPCTIKSNQKGNGLGCSWYALNDICPDDETKGYWECLPK